MALSFGEKLKAALVPAGFEQTARLLRAGGFSPLEYYADALNTVIDIDCTVENMNVLARRLHRYLLSARIASYVHACEGPEEEDDPYIAIEAVYDPENDEATIELWGLRDELL